MAVAGSNRAEAIIRPAITTLLPGGERHTGHDTR
jgi:hypothetical protein